MTGAAANFNPQATRSERWKWYICVLLLFGTVVNYMDRLTTNILANPIQTAFELNKQEYGYIEWGFGLGFASGSLLWGALVDKFGVFWLYPAALIGWSAMGFLTGRCENFTELIVLRTMLGIFEAGHFPCGLKTVQLLMPPRDRAMGNSLLQSGTAVGAILAPQAIKLLMTDGPDGWRLPFQVIGAGGCVWVIFWLWSIRPADLRAAARAQIAYAATSQSNLSAASPPSFRSILTTPRFLALLIMVVCINQNWHFFRVWMQQYLEEARHYSFSRAADLTTAYYLAADIGVLSAGALAGWLARRGRSVFASRMWVFGICCTLTTVTSFLPVVPTGPLFLAIFFTIGFGGLGCFASYYSLTQDLSVRHQGKISGTLATCTWVLTSTSQPLTGWWIDRTHDYNSIAACMGWLPMIALVSVLMLWNRGQSPAIQPAAPVSVPEPSG